MNPEHWWTFSIITFLICFSPGPNMLHMMRSGASHGFRRTFFSMMGCFVAVSGMIAISVAGIGALLAASPLLFEGLRWGGACYLFYLGIQIWRSPVAGDAGDEKQEAPHTFLPAATLFRNGFLIGISNPKALLFAGAFFPQFIDAGMPRLPQLTILFLTFTVLEFFCYSLYAFGGHSIARLLRRASIRKAFNRLTGGLFALFAALLVAKTV